jgi:hypothetical protein
MIALRRHIAALATLPESEAPVLSAYFDLRRPIEAQRAAFGMWATSARVTIGRDARRWFDAARADMEPLFRQTWAADIRSVAAFVRAGDHPLLMVMPFRATLDSHFAAGRLAAIFPLVQLKDRFHRFVVAIGSEDSARIFEITLGSVSEEILTTRPDMHGRLGREWSREHYHHRKTEDDRRFQRDQVAVITNLMAKRGLNHLILAGHPRHVARLSEALPKHIKARVAGTVFHSPNGHDPSAVLEQSVAAFIEAERNESRDTVERLHEQVRRGGLAVIGVHPCREAILSGCVGQLVISEGLPHADREELVRLATARDLAIEVCEGDELLASHGGVGCLLRYRPEFLVNAKYEVSDALGETGELS